MVGNFLDRGLKTALGVITILKERRDNVYKKGEELINKAPQPVKDLVSSINAVRSFAREKLLEKIAGTLGKTGLVTYTDVQKIMKKLEEIEKKLKKG